MSSVDGTEEAKSSPRAPTCAPGQTKRRKAKMLAIFVVVELRSRRRDEEIIGLIILEYSPNGSDYYRGRFEVFSVLELSTDSLFVGVAA